MQHQSERPFQFLLVIRFTNRLKNKKVQEMAPASQPPFTHRRFKFCTESPSIAMSLCNGFMQIAEWHGIQVPQLPQEHI